MIRVRGWIRRILRIEMLGLKLVPHPVPAVHVLTSVARREQWAQQVVTVYA